MVGIIILENGAGFQSVRDMACTLLSIAPQAQIIAITDSNDQEPFDSIKTFLTTPNNWQDSIKQATQQLDSDRILLLDANLCLTSDLAGCLVNAHLQTADQTVSYLGHQSDSTLVEPSEISIDSLIDAIAHQSSWPLIALDLPKALADRCDIADCQEGSIYLAVLLVAAITTHHTLQRFEGIETEDVAVSNGRDLKDLDRARMMRTVVSNCNIEELFPDYAWKEWDKESAAAAYHSLAAHFIRLGDTESALECLGLSDQLEDSPRSLALKGLIAMKQGESLTAVANMVSSLQQYEIRKKEATQHYISFSPNDMSEINRRLNLGLKALNQRDNETAACHFAEAIFDFDRFYQEYGVTLRA